MSKDETSPFPPLEEKSFEEKKEERKRRQEERKKRQEEKSSALNQIKEEGNKAFRESDFEEAINIYQRGIDQNQGKNEEWKGTGLIRDIQAVFYSNISTCYFKLDKFDLSLKSSISAISHNDESEKIMEKYAKIIKSKDFVKGYVILLNGSKKFPNNALLTRTIQYFKTNIIQKLHYLEVIKHTLKAEEIMNFMLSQMIQCQRSNRRMLNDYETNLVLVCLETMYSILKEHYVNGCDYATSKLIDPLDKYGGADEFGLYIHQRAHMVPLRVLPPRILDYFYNFKMTTPVDEHLAHSKKKDDWDTEEWNDTFQSLHPEMFIYQFSFLVLTVLMRLANELDCDKARKTLIRAGMSRRARMNGGSSLTEACTLIVGRQSPLGAKEKYIKFGGAVVSCLDYAEDSCFQERSRSFLESITDDQWTSMELGHLITFWKLFMFERLKNGWKRNDKKHVEDEYATNLSLHVLKILLEKRTDFIHFIYNAKKYRKKRCFYCRSKRKKSKLKRCSRCKRAYYCSRDCQKRHWSTSHKVYCVKGDEEWDEKIRSWELFSERLKSFLKERGFSDGKKIVNVKELLDEFGEIVAKEHEEEVEKNLKRLGFRD